MATEKTAEQLVDLLKSVLDAMMRNVFTLQDQGERMLNLMIDQGVIVQQEGRRMLNAWLAATRKAGDQYAGMIRRYIQTFREHLSPAPESRPAGKKRRDS
jgi:polyhydroxyalkanoate synthesis regulator phasin